MYKYETHLHTYPVSNCAKVGVCENIKFYKKMGYDGVFITNHFLDNTPEELNMSYDNYLNYYFSDYEKGLKIGRKLGIKVFLGAEITYKGTDFLIYGLNEDWYQKNSQILNMNIKEKLSFMSENGALIIQAHPFREAGYIDHIRLFPRSVHGVEIYNACRTELENKSAEIYADSYNLIKFAGTDNHIGNKQPILSGMCSEEEISNEKDFVKLVKNNKMQIFTIKNKE